MSMATRVKKPTRQRQVCPRCGHMAEMSATSGPCLCPRCLVRRLKCVDMVRLK
jgi:NADH pyrophosphatase NudC (nudix superfamily)